MLQISTPTHVVHLHGTPTHKLAKFLLKLLTPSTASSFTVIDSFHFAEEICQQDSNLHMTSLDVDSLFTNIPIEETISICVGNLYNDNKNPPKIPKHSLHNLLNIATKDTFFKFNNKILTLKPVVSTVPKKNLIIALPYLGKLSLQIHTRINCIRKNKLPYCNIWFVFQNKCKISNFGLLKTKCHRSYVLALFTYFSVVAAMLPITAKLSVILKSECVNTWEFYIHSEKS